MTAFLAVRLAGKTVATIIAEPLPADFCASFYKSL
jgi:hypothetical protein